MEEQKCVVVLTEGLPPGIAANIAAILGAALAKKLPDTIGGDIFDRAGRLHAGISRLPVPILQADAAALAALREAFGAEAGCTVADFPALAQRCRTYAEYAARLGEADPEGLSYLGVAVCGPARIVRRWTGRLALLR